MNIITKIEGTRNIRLLPWHYDEPGKLVRMVTLRRSTESCRLPVDAPYPTFLAPGTFGVPDPLWETRKRDESSVTTWEFYVAPCIDLDAKPWEVKLIRLLPTIYHLIVERILGTPKCATWVDAEDLLEGLHELPGDMPLSEALARIEGRDPETGEQEWVVEPLDVTSPEEGCNISITRSGRGIETKYALRFGREGPIGLEDVAEQYEVLQDPERYDVLDDLRAHFGDFDMKLYAEACQRNGTLLTGTVRRILAAKIGGA